jgi:NCS2 family nucleobase:cation symporter-2
MESRRPSPSRPENLLYGVADRPPTLTCALLALQHLSILLLSTVYLLFALTAAGVGPEETTQAIRVAFAVIGIGTLLLCQAGSHFGSGYLIPWAFSGIYVGATVAAARRGGMPLVLGMTLFAGLVEMVLSRVIGRFRSFFPTEISGLCVVLVGLSLGVLGAKSLFGVVQGSAAPAPGAPFLLGCGALSVMVGVHVWGGPRIRQYSPIIGIVVAYLVALPAGLVDTQALAAVAEAPLVALPEVSPRLPSFDLGLAIPFFAVALACCLRVMGDVAVSQKVNDRNWVRPDPRTMSGGALADGAATILAASAGCVGGTSSASSVGLATGTGVTARVVGLWIGGLLILLSALPATALFYLSIPGPVLGAAILFSGSFVLVNGLQIVMSRALDARKTLVIGLSLTTALSRSVLPEFYAGLPPSLQPYFVSDLAMGLIAALALNAVFRIGVRSREAVLLPPDAGAIDAIRDFLEMHGSRWGARRDVLQRAIFGACQSVEAVIDHCSVTGGIAVEAAFDEYNLDIRLSYAGDLLVLGEEVPSHDEIVSAPDGLLRLAGYLVRGNADRVQATARDGQSVLVLHFDH